MQALISKNVFLGKLGESGSLSLNYYAVSNRPLIEYGLIVFIDQLIDWLIDFWRFLTDKL